MTEKILEYSSGEIVARLDKTYKKLVHDISFTIHVGESLALIGETGSGKTMIALSLMGLLPYNVHQKGGSMVFCDSNVFSDKKRRSLLGTKVVYIPQNGHEFLNPSKKIKYHLYDSLLKVGVPSASLWNSACDRLSVSGLTSPEEIMEKYPFQLSGGMAQRVTIALAACAKADLIIADEPTNGLDANGKSGFIGLLERIFPRAGKLVITHDISVAVLCRRILVLCGGRQMETDEAAHLVSSPRHPYTQALFAALVENGMKETPILRKENGLCPFYRRCAFVQPDCRYRMPLQKEDLKEWWCCKK